MAKAAYPTIGIAAFVMFGTVYFIGCLPTNYQPPLLGTTSVMAANCIKKMYFIGCLRFYKLVVIILRLLRIGF